MISWETFETSVCKVLKRDISENKNSAQNNSIKAPVNQSMFIVAGPGSGKTTLIALRVLKMIYVDDIKPGEILVTTFTKKAASELRSRILGWGDQLKQTFLADESLKTYHNQIKNLNLNQVISGTIDSIAEETLTQYRAPGSPPPVVIEEFVSNTLMVTTGLFNHGRFNNNDLRNYIIQLKGTAWGVGVSEIGSIIKEIKERICHDLVDINEYRTNATCEGVSLVCDAISDYTKELEDNLLYDFSRLEKEFLEKLQNKTLVDFLSKIKIILVDEYQDTNLLQEQIYFEIGKACLDNGGSVTVVGDDDQSLYHFRGATVDLFRTFQHRIQNTLGIKSKIIYLSINYRSTNEIVNFCNNFVCLDQAFQNVRVTQKPQILTGRSTQFINFPVLGMFRNDLTTLARDLSQFIHDIIHGQGRQVRTNEGNELIQIRPEGSPADIALLFSSPRELTYSDKARLPFLLRQELNQLNPSIQVFNPRGQSVQEIPEIRLLCGLVLECIDPDSQISISIRSISDNVRRTFRAWRNDARVFINNNPNPITPLTLGQFVNNWQNRTPFGTKKWKREVPLIDLVYKLVTWIPQMQDDIEGTVYLEVITRTITQSALFNKFKSQLIFDASNIKLEQASIREIIRNILIPIASGVLEVNEELLETLPTDRINIMSIHQAKGLEFPLVIVDVGSDFNRNYPAQAFKRFPINGGKTCTIEDELRQHSTLRVNPRSGRDRAFDDLIRKYFVAYSRSIDVLLLVGLNSSLTHIQNVATGWDRTDTWHWQQGLQNLIHI